jgi:hypothetical protein
VDRIVTVPAKNEPDVGARAPHGLGMQVGSAAGYLLRLQRSAGNRATCGVLAAGAAPQTALLQRRALPSLRATVLGSIAFDIGGGERHSGVVRVERELVPLRARPAGFPGYEARLEAIARCWQEQGALCAVVEDDSRRFHAVRTNWPARDVRVQGLSLAPAEQGFRSLQWVHTTDERTELLPRAAGARWQPSCGARRTRSGLAGCVAGGAHP